MRETEETLRVIVSRRGSICWTGWEEWSVSLGERL